MAEDIKTTLQFNADITDFRGAMQEAKRAVGLANSEFKEATASMDKWSESTDGLRAKISQLSKVEQAEQRKLAVLEAQYAAVAAEQGENSSAAVLLQTQLNNQKAAVKKTQKELDKYASALEDAESSTDDAGGAAEDTTKEVKKLDKAADKAADSLDDVDDASDDAAGGLQALEKVASVAQAGIAAIGAVVAGTVAAFFAAAESTRDYRREMAYLSTNAQNAGHDVDEMKETLSGVATVTGDTEAAMEGLNMLMATGMDTEGVQAAADALAGAALKFDGLNFESLSEGLQETLATGAAVGPFAELIERTGGDIEAFNAGLAACTDEASRQQYVMSWLASSGMADVHDAYVQNNADLVAAEQAQFRLNDAIAAIGAIAEPIMTSLKNAAAGLLEAITPFVSLIGEGLTLAMTDADGAASLLSEGIGGLLDTLITKATEAIPMLLDVAATLLPSLLTTIADALPQVVTAILEVLPQLITALLEALPTLIESLFSMLGQILVSLGEMLPQIVSAIIAFIPVLVQSLLDNIPTLLQAAITFLMAIVDALPELITQLLAALPQIIDTLSAFLSENIPVLLDAAVMLLMAIVDALPQILDALIAALPDIIDSIVNFCTENTPVILDAAITLLMAIVDAIPDIISALLEKLPEIIATIFSAIVDAAPEMLETAKSLFGKITEAAGDLLEKIPEKMRQIISSIGTGISNGLSTIKEKAGELFSSIWDSISGLPDKVLELGSNIVQGLWNGISNMSEWIGEKIKGFGSGVLNGIKNFFGIESPSKLMRDEVGQYIGLGMAEGIENSKSAIAGAVRELGAAATGGLSAGIGQVDGGKQIIFNQTNNSPRALSRREIYRQTHNALSYAGGVL